MKRPNNRRNLDAIHKLTNTEEEYVRYRTTLAHTIVGQMLPRGVVKGGTSLKTRYGFSPTRFTTDLDAARAEDIESFIAQLGVALDVGWEGFSGHIVSKRPAQPKDVPSEYVMRPYSIKMDYFGRPWCTVSLEVGHNEIGDAEEPEYCIASEIVEMFTKLGLPEPNPIPLMPLHHQVAQKLHGVSEEGSSRAHDLVDLQVILRDESLDLCTVRDTCKRLFAYRKKQDWPPAITVGEGWQELYSEARTDLYVIDNVEEAVAWANKLIQRICAAE